MYTYNNTDMDNLGGIVGGVYGITDNWNLKFSLGYMNTELNSTKADNFYTGIDLNYNSLAKADEIGVGVTSSLMLTPRKSITAIIGLVPKVDDVEVEKQSCKFCPKVDCNFRTKDFEPQPKEA